jgi:hypothetical protein
VSQERHECWDQGQEECEGGGGEDAICGEQVLQAGSEGKDLKNEGCVCVAADEEPYDLTAVGVYTVIDLDAEARQLIV